MTVDEFAEQHRFLSRPPPFEPPRTPSSSDHHEPGTPIPPRHAATVRRNRGARSAVDGGGDRAPVQPSDDVRSATDRAARILIEVIDRRRSSDQLRPLFTAEMIELVRTIVRNPPPGRRLGVATLHRVHVVTRSAASAEFFGTYARGPRLFAFAGRMECAIDTRRPGWTVTSLHVG